MPAVVRASSLKVIVFLFVCGGLCGRGMAQASQPAGPTVEQRAAVIKSAIQQTIDSFDKIAQDPREKFEARQLTLYAHYVLALGLPAAKAETMLKRAMACQDMDPKSPHFGEFPAREGGDLARPPGMDPNAQNAVCEVTVLPMAQILIRYGDQLSPETRDKMRDSLKAALAVIRKHQWPMDLANVYLQAAADELLIGEILHDQRAISEGEVSFTTFAAISKSRGVEEYVAPDFTAVQLNAVLIAQNYTLQPDAKHTLDPIAKFIWAQIAANVVPRRGVLGGPHSRDADFVFGMGAVDSYLYLEGMRDTEPSIPAFSEGMRAYLNYVERAWRPDDDIRRLTRVPRVVISRWGLLNGRDRYFYVNDAYAMGCVSQDASPEDRDITFEFASPRLLPAVWVVPDYFDAPFGHVAAPDGSMLRPSHLSPALAAVQEKNTLLAIMNLRSSVRGQAFPSLATNIVFPRLVDELRVDGKAIDNSKPFDVIVKPDSMLMMRIGPAALIVRFFDVDGALGQQPVFKLSFDGNRADVARLVAYHLSPGTNQQQQPCADRPLRAGVIFLAQDVHSDADVDAFFRRAADIKLESSVKDSAWRAKLVDGTTTLETALNLDTDAILTRNVNGAEFQSASFTVNGKDIAGAILGY